MKERKYWVDYTKTSGIYFVILGHFTLKNATAESFIYSFQLPMFFVLSGFLSNLIINKYFPFMLGKKKLAASPK